jgi:ribosomal RNA assembly protein
MTVVHVRIPEERIPVLIGTGGAVKRALESRSGATVEIDPEDQTIRISAPPGGDPIGVLKARDVAVAVGRGFSPERAFRLLREDTYLAVVSMKEASGKQTKEAMRRLRARLIGTSGRARSRMEELSGCSLSIYGASVALIGTAEQLERGTRGVQMLLRGSEHSSVFGYLNRARRQSLMGPGMPRDDPSGPGPGLPPSE